MGDIEIGNCDVCNVKTHLQRKYYYYDIKCECHSPRHFELVRHCKDCQPEPPSEFTVQMKPTITN